MFYPLIIYYPDGAEIISFSIVPGGQLYNYSFTANCTVEGNPEPEVSIVSSATGKILYKGMAVGTVSVKSPQLNVKILAFGSVQLQTS